MKLLATQWRVAAIVVVIAASLASAPNSPYSTHEKAFFADGPTVQFVRPGLVIKVNSAQIAADGTISTVYTISDPQGLPLDSAGVTTPGTINENDSTALSGSFTDPGILDTHTVAINWGDGVTDTLHHAREALVPHPAKAGTDKRSKRLVG